MSDLAQRKESYPVWADIDFLERGGLNTIEAGTKDVNAEIVQLRFEIAKLKQENKDFSAELEKAQNLLTLQKDIDRDNHSYYENEKQRPQL